MNIISYLENNNVVIGEENFQNKAIYSNDDEEIKKQLDLIIDVQSILKNQKNTLIPRIESNIGKEIENFKVYLKRLIKNLQKLNNCEEISYLDEVVLNEGKKIIVKAENALNSIDSQQYMELIKRSMNNYEMCIGRVDESNLNRDSRGAINIRTTKYVSYNLIEHDIYNYIKRLRRRGYTDSVNKLIEYYIEKNLLNYKSYNYIKLLVNFPIDEIKLLTKYFLNKSSKTTNRWIEEINITSRNYGKELI